MIDDTPLEYRLAVRRVTGAVALLPGDTRRLVRKQRYASVGLWADRGVRRVKKRKKEQNDAPEAYEKIGKDDHSVKNMYLKS